MGFANDEENGNVVGNDRDGQDVRVGGTRLARELQRVRSRQVGSLQLYEIAREYGLSEDSVWSSSLNSKPSESSLSLATHWPA